MSSVGRVPLHPVSHNLAEGIDYHDGPSGQISSVPAETHPAVSGHAPVAQQAVGGSPFDVLAQYGEHTLYYRQRDSRASDLTSEHFNRANLKLTESQQAEVKEEGAGGVCQGLSMAWLAERLQTSNSSLQRFAPTRKYFKSDADASALASAPQDMPAEAKAKKLAITARGAAAHLVRPSRGSSYAESSLEMRQRASLSIHPFHEDTGKTGDILPHNAPLHPSPADGLQHKPFSSVMTEASERLRPGEGLTATMTIKNSEDRFEGRHEMAMYKSRAGTLRFFDPDGGEFKVTHPEEFFTEYQAMKADDRNWRLSFVTDGRNPDKLSFYRR